MIVRVAIVDGHTLTRYGLRHLLDQESDVELIAESPSAARAVQMIEEFRPDVVTIDSSLPDGDGMRLASDLRDLYGDLGIVILTSRTEDHVLFRALETGASAFVAKTAPVEEVLGAIRHAAVAASSFTASGLAVALARRRTAQGEFLLSARETEVLRLLRDGLSFPAIAQAMFISHSTAKTYAARLYEKLGATNRTQALITALQRGLIDYEPDGAVGQPPARQGRRSNSSDSFGRAAIPCGSVATENLVA